MTFKGCSKVCAIFSFTFYLPFFFTTQHLSTYFNKKKKKSLILPVRRRNQIAIKINGCQLSHVKTFVCLPVCKALNKRIVWLPRNKHPLPSEHFSEIASKVNTISDWWPMTIGCMIVSLLGICNFGGSFGLNILEEAGNQMYVFID